jgi:glycosyltransferase involved in cell wall biosynthesis
MLDICIPVLNYDVTTLVYSLHRQCTNNCIKFRILIFEDGSTTEFIKINKAIESLPDILYFVYSENIGRSAARNFLINKSTENFLLFLDCDSRVDNDNFISNYLKNTEYNVVCGGTKYVPEQKQAKGSLRYKYGIGREMIPAAKRNDNPNSAFAANNFMISSEALKKVKFREFLKAYGHEDSLFGYELKINGFNIHHIDNQVIHAGIEDNSDFLKKTEDGIKNLLIIESSDLVDRTFTNEIRIIKFYHKLKKLHIVWAPSILFSLFKNKIKNHLLFSHNPCLFLFDLYKIGYYCKLKAEENEK